MTQASKTLKSSVVLTPPQRRPKKRTSRLSLSIVIHVTTYKQQYSRHACFRPYRSARLPAKDALMPPDTKPVA